MSVRIPMTFATGLGPLPELLEERAGSKAVARAFAAVNLPLHLVTDRAHRVPLAAMVCLFDHAARLAGDARFGLDVGRAMQPEIYGRWVRFSLQAETLGGAIARLARCVVLHQVGGRLSLQSSGRDDVIWGYRQEAVLGPMALQHNDHVMPVMLQVARAYCGPAWLPDRIVAACPDPGDGTGRMDLMQALWQFDAATSGLVFPARALWARRATPQDTGAHLSAAEVLAEIRQRRAETATDRVSAILALRLLDGDTDIDGAARMAGLGRRSLQRQLDREGISYRALLDTVRMTRARALIAGTAMPLAEIAHQVGYSDPAHFTRAFRRHFGTQPSTLRKPRDAEPASSI